MTTTDTDPEVARADIAADVLKRLNQLGPGWSVKIVAKLIATAPEIVAAVLDELEARLAGAMLDADEKPTVLP